MNDKITFLVAVSMVFGPLVLPIVLAVLTSALEALFGGSGEVKDLRSRSTESIRKAG